MTLWAGLDGPRDLVAVPSTADVALSRPRRPRDAVGAILRLEARAGDAVVAASDLLVGDWLWTCAADFSLVCACVPLHDGRGKLSATCCIEFVGNGSPAPLAPSGTALRVFVDRARLDSVDIM